MNIFKIILPAIIVLSYSGISRADSVVISFEGGKTQTVTLDGSIKSIKAVQYLTSSDQSNVAPISVAPQTDTTTSTPANEANPPQHQQDPAKPKVKFKWADPIIGQ